MAPQGIGLHLTRELPAAPERVFAAWTDPALIRRWFAPPGMEVAAAEVDLRVGGAYRIAIGGPGEPKLLVVTGVYQEISPPGRLVFTWAWESEPMDGTEHDGHETVVTLQLVPAGPGTRVELTHELFRTSEERESHAGGWGACLDQLEKLL